MLDVPRRVAPDVAATEQAPAMGATVEVTKAG